MTNYSFKINLVDAFTKGFSALNGMLAKSTSSFAELSTKAFAFNQLGQAMQGGFDILSGPIQKAGQLSDAMAVVQKNTGATTAQMADLKKTIDGIDTRTATLALLDMASVGGKLGVPIAELKGFVKVVDMANVALGDEFGNNAEVVATNLAKIKNQFAEFKNTTWEESLLRIGSAVNYLGKQGANSAPNLTEFAKRFSATGLELSKSLGIGAALEEMGMDAERGASGVKNVLDLMGKESMAFSQHLKMSKKDFEKLLNTDKNAALLKFLESMRGATTTQIAQTFKSLKIGNQESSDAVSKLANNIGLMQKRQEQASTAIQKGTDIQGEFALMNETLGAKLDKAKKRMDAVATAIGGLLAPYAPVIQTTGMLTMSFMQLAPVLSAAWTGLISLGKSFVSASVNALLFTSRILFQSVILSGQFILSLFKATTYTNLFAKTQAAASAVSMAFVRAQFIVGASISMLSNRIKAFSALGFIGGMKAMAASAWQTSVAMLRSAAMGISAWVTSLFAATAAQIGLNIAMTANPIGVVIAGIAALAGAVWLIVENWDVIKGWLMDLGAFIWKYSPMGLLIQATDALFPGFIARLKEWGGVILEFFQGIWTKVKELWDIVAPALGLGDMSVKMEDIKLPEYKKTEDKIDGKFSTGLNLTEKGTKQGGVASNGIVSGQANIQSAQPKNITINIGALVSGGVTIATTNVTEGASQLKDMVTEYLISAVNDVNTY